MKVLIIYFIYIRPLRLKKRCRKLSPSMGTAMDRGHGRLPYPGASNTSARERACPIEQFSYCLLTGAKQKNAGLKT